MVFVRPEELELVLLGLPWLFESEIVKERVFERVPEPLSEVETEYTTEPDSLWLIDPVMESETQVVGV